MSEKHFIPLSVPNFSGHEKEYVNEAVVSEWVSTGGSLVPKFEQAVADYVGFNEKYFSTRFAKECGCTFIAYLNGLRIQRAGQLLLQTDMKIYEVCEAVGYNNVEHFNHPHLHLLPAVHPGGRCRRRRQGINRQTFFSHLLFFFDQGPGPFARPGP